MIRRFDTDTDGAESLEKAYNEIFRGGIDIIIGTQMVTKGFDLPQLGMVGMPFADSSLYIPDFTADEQTYQLLTQVMGRVARHRHSTQIVVQTYNASQPIIQQALTKNWVGFYNKQLLERQEFHYPPFTYLLQLTYSAQREESAKRAANLLATKLKNAYPSISLLGPSPRFHHKTNNSFNWQLIIKAKKREQLLSIISVLPAGWRHNIDPVNLL
jgi:primosomal protein N' (replication factor Y)